MAMLKSHWLSSAGRWGWKSLKKHDVTTKTEVLLTTCLLIAAARPAVTCATSRLHLLLLGKCKPAQ